MQELDVHHVPRRLVRITFRIIVVILGIERRVIRIACFHDFCGARNLQRVGIAVIEQDPITEFDRVTQEIPGLIVPHPIPERRLPGGLFQILDRKCVGF